MGISKRISWALSGAGVLLAAALACISVPGTKAQDKIPTLTIKKDETGGVTLGLTKDDPIKTLTQIVDYPGVNDPKATLEDGLKDLMKKYELQSEINEKAFAADGLADPSKVLIADPEMPSMSRTVDSVVRQLLARVHTRSGATYLVRANHIEITTNAAARAEIWGADFKGPFPALVNLKVRKMRLSDALDELAVRNDLNVVCVPDSAKEVSATLTNVPADTAVRALANQAGLTMIQWDNVFLVTTADQAATLMKEFREVAPVFKNPAEYHLWRRGYKESQLCSSITEKVDLFIDKFREVIKYPGLNDPKATLADVFRQIRRRHAVENDINVQALKADGAQDGDETLIADPHELPALEETLDGVIRGILARVPAKSGATYVIRSDHIEITTRAAVRREVWGEKYDGPFWPLVNLRAGGMALTNVLDRLAEQSHLNIVYLAGPTKAGISVNVRLANVPADTAVRALAAQAGLTMVQRDNTLQVMTLEQAAALKKECLQEGPDSAKVRRGSVVPPPATEPKEAM